MNGLIFFEDGTVVPFGQLQTARHIALKAQEIIPRLLKQERDQLLSSVTKEELKQIVEIHALQDEQDEHDNNI